ncbi:MAG TPA: cellulase family glycosylhydrolase [Prolixibacteraceae bacterium]|nr:cellulase family glycosylhydrolase [Prolixibacteraceae bacterium]
MKIGWNLGNTLEATWVPRSSFGTTTQTAIDSVKAAGFNTVRLPVAWFHHSDTITSQIDAAWLAHVKKIVDYCIKDSMYVIINAHWDHGWLENRVNAANKDIVNTRQQKYWTQIAYYFKDYDDHLLFAGANEPNVHDAPGMSILLSYHQTFIDAVRATGGNNSSRTLIIQGPSTDIDNTNRYMNTMPTDPVPERLMVEVHYYTPWNFCGLNGDASWGKMFYYWGKGNHSTTDVTRNATWGEESDMDKYLTLMKTKFIDKGIPVIIGEYGAFRRKLSAPSDQALHNASINTYYSYFVKSATKMGFVTYCWDTGGIFNFTTGKTNDREVLNAIMQGAKSATTDIAFLNENSIEIYPNPFTTSFNLKINHPQYVNHIMIFDRMGHPVETVAPSAVKNLLNLGEIFKPDLYIVQVNERNWTRSFKVIKMK